RVLPAFIPQVHSARLPAGKSAAAVCAGRIDRQSRPPGDAESAGGAAGRASRQLYEQATTLERLVRQQLILDDPQLIDDYGRLRQDFRQTTQQLMQLPLDRTQIAQLERLAENESGLFSLLKTPQRPAGSAKTLADGYATMAEDAQAMLNATNRLTEREIEHLQQTAAEG